MVSKESNIVYLGLGSNLGNKPLNIKDAIFRTSEKIRVLKISSIEETTPVGYKEQPNFLNCTLKAQTKLGLNELFEFVKGIEKQMGRKPGFKYGPRLIDIDILFFNQEIVDCEDYKVPHPRLHERRFVLKSMAEISRDFVHPVLGKSMSELLDMMGE